MTDPLSPQTPGTTPPWHEPAPPPAVPEGLHPAQQFLLNLWINYRYPVMGGLIALLAFTVILGHVGRLRAERRHEATDRLNRASAIYQTVIVGQEIDRETADQLLEQAIDLCGQIRLEFPKNRAAHRAQYIAGNCHYERAFQHLGTAESAQALEMIDAAANSFQEYLEEATDDQDRADGLIALAACLENRSFFTGDAQFMRSAIARLEEARALGEGTYREALALTAMGRCQESLGRSDEARQTYGLITRLRRPLAATQGTGALSLTTSTGGYSELATERLERIESGIDTPRGT
jgi:tetratricopeptide (TPR) repeat protein